MSAFTYDHDPAIARHRLTTALRGAGLAVSGTYQGEPMIGVVAEEGGRVRLMPFGIPVHRVRELIGPPLCFASVVERWTAETVPAADTEHRVYQAQRLWDRLAASILKRWAGEHRAVRA